MMYQLYKTLTSLLKPAVKYVIQKRLESGKEDKARLNERYGIASLSRPKGPIIWFHAASVGESLSILSLIKQLLKLHESFTILVTTTTLSSAHLMEAKLPQRCIHQYIPYDVIEWVEAFLNHWHPNLALWVESEFWPNLLYQTQKRRIPMILLNASLSDKSYRKWIYIKSFPEHFLNLFKICLAQSQQDLEKLKGLGAKNVLYSGNLKYASAPLNCDEVELERLKKAVEGRPIWVAASTHPGEEEIILASHALLKQDFPNLVTFLIPRHPERRAEVKSLIQSQNLEMAQRSQDQPIQRHTEIYLGDTLGELGLFYRLCPVAFVGGSLETTGGHNLIEPAQLECAILHGYNMSNFLEMVSLFHDRQAAIEVKGSVELADRIREVWQQPALLRNYQQNAKKLAEEQVKVIEIVLHELLPYLKNLVENEHQRTSILV